MAYSLDPVQNEATKFTLQSLDIMQKMEDEKERIDNLSLCEKLSYIVSTYLLYYYYNYYAFYFNKKDYKLFQYNCALYSICRKYDI